MCPAEARPPSGGPGRDPQRHRRVAKPDSVDDTGNPVSYDAANLLAGDPSTAWRVGLIPGYAKTDPGSGPNPMASPSGSRPASSQIGAKWQSSGLVRVDFCGCPGSVNQFAA